MIKILHTSDWHVGHSLYGFDRSDEHAQFFNNLAQIVSDERPDALVVAGDIFHYSSPSAAAQKLFTEGLLRVCRACDDMQTFVVAGNHDSASRLDANSSLWRDHHVHVVTNLRAIDENVFVLEGKGVVACVPYFNTYHVAPDDVFAQVEAKVNELNVKQLPTILVAHLAVGSAEHTLVHEDGIGGMDFVPLKHVARKFDYVALGHIHCPQNIKGSDGRARYCGTPFAMAFDEAKHPHCADIVTIQHDAQPEIRHISLPTDVRLLTLPAQPVALDDALAELRKLPADDRSFVQLNVLVDDILDQNARSRAIDIIAERNMSCRFCLCKITRRDAEFHKENRPMSVEEVKLISPIVLARVAYEVIHKNKMSDDVEKLMNQAINTIETCES